MELGAQFAVTALTSEMLELLVAVLIIMGRLLFCHFHFDGFLYWFKIQAPVAANLERTNLLTHSPSSSSLFRLQPFSA